jgi:hypothetical protein
VKRLHINSGLTLHSFSFPAKNISSTFKKLIAPLIDLVGVEVKLLGKLSQGLFAANSSKRYF